MVSAAKQPKHAPSAKLALDDVLKSLQDLIRNDLPEITSPPDPAMAEPAPTALAGPVIPPPTAKDLILELEAGLADLNTLDPTPVPVELAPADPAPVEPLAAAISHAPGKVTHTRLPPSEITSASTHVPGVGVGSNTPLAARATPPIAPPIVVPQSALSLATSPSLSAPANPDIDSLTGVKLEQDPAKSLMSEFLREKAQADPDFLPLEVASVTASTPAGKTGLGATQSNPPPVAAPKDTDILPHTADHRIGEPTGSLASEFLQERLPDATQLAALENVHLDFSDHGETFTIEQDQSLSAIPDNPHTPMEGLSWHAAEFNLPAAELPGEATLSALDEPTAKPAGRPVSFGLQSELPLPDPAPHPSAATPHAAQQTPTAKPAAPAANIHSGNEDNIPLLQDVIEPVGTSVPSAHAPALNPGPEQSRRMAIQVAARLNVELRRSGKHALSSDVITRLARMLQETLAQSPPNVDNKPHNKD